MNSFAPSVLQLREMKEKRLAQSGLGGRERGKRRALAHLFKHLGIVGGEDTFCDGFIGR